MKPIIQSFADMLLDAIEYTERLIGVFYRKPQPQPSLLALNVDWFTHCNWREQLIAFKQIDVYRSNKH